MLTSDRFIWAGNIINAFAEDNAIDPEVLEAIQILKDGCYEAIQILRRVRGRFISGEKDNVPLQNQFEGRM